MGEIKIGLGNGARLLRQNPFHHIAEHVGQSHVAALGPIGETFMIDTGFAGLDTANFLFNAEPACALELIPELAPKTPKEG